MNFSPRLSFLQSTSLNLRALLIVFTLVGETERLEGAQLGRDSFFCWDNFSDKVL